MNQCLLAYFFIYQLQRRFCVDYILFTILTLFLVLKSFVSVSFTDGSEGYRIFFPLWSVISFCPAVWFTCQSFQKHLKILEIRIGSLQSEFHINTLAEAECENMPKHGHESYKGDTVGLQRLVCHG